MSRPLAWLACLALALAPLATAGASAGVIDTYAGGGQSRVDGTPLRQLDLAGSTTIAVDPRGRVYVGMPGRILRLGGGIGRTVVGTGEPGFSGDGGPATEARTGAIGALAFDNEGRLLFADQDALRIRRVEHDGTVQTIAGNGSDSDAVSSVLATEAGMAQPMGLAVGLDGTVYISTAGQHIRCFMPGGSVGNCYGTGQRGYSGDGWLAWGAHLNSPMAMTMDDAGRLLLVDRGNNRIRRIGRDNMISSVVGINAHQQGGVSASLTDYWGVAVDAYRRVYFGLGNGHKVHRTSLTNTLETVAGTGNPGHGGDGGPASQATLDRPRSLAVGPDQTLYILDQAGAIIRRVQASPQVAGVPSAPSIPRVDAAHFEAFIAFDPPRSDGGAAITGYEVETSPAGGVDTAAGTLATFRKITGLDWGEPYTFRVRALNARGASAWSGTSMPLQWGDHMATYAGVSPLDRTVTEGDAGWHPVPYRLELNRKLPVPLLFDVWSMEFGEARQGDDFDISHLKDVVVPAGARSIGFDVMLRGDTTPELGEGPRFVVGNFRGAMLEVEPQFTLSIHDNDGDDAPQAPEFLAVDDEYRVVPEGGEQFLDVMVNDHWQGTDTWGIRVLDQPFQGTAELYDPDPTRIDDDVLRYVPRPGARGEDTFTYMLINGFERSEARVRVVISPFADVNEQVGSPAGSVQVAQAIGWDQAAAAFRATPLVSARRVVADAAAQAAGRYQSVFTVPAVPGSTARRFRVLLDARGEQGRDLLLTAGQDVNEDLGIEPVETQCSVAVPDKPVQRCAFTLELPPGRAGHYWIQVSYRDGLPGPLEIDRFEIPDQPSDGSLAVTGPSRLEAGSPVGLRVGWNDFSLLDGQARAGYVHVAEGDRTVGGFHVRLDAAEVAAAPVPLFPGVPRKVALAPGEAFTGAFVEVPEGMTRLRVLVRSSQDVDLAITPVPDGDASLSRVASIPDASAAPHVVSGAGGNHVFDLAAPSAGRWFVALRHGPGASGAAAAELSVELDGVAPKVRAGSYFNAARSGHGLFLYPAGSQLAGLWYTYLEDGSPTWYYLQGPAPAANGAWTAGLYRSSWLGERNHLVPVGQVMVSPRGPDAFQFSYLLDGIAGSEPLASLGRGCPVLGGTPVDASSHWFDPRLAGTGYSVQLWPDYEFHAAFVYDRAGVARFLTAEAPRFLGADGQLVVQQLADGPCPSCDEARLPVRIDVGGLSRRVGAQGIEWMDLDAVLRGKAKGDWTQVHRTQLLGGAGTSQGCQP